MNQPQYNLIEISKWHSSKVFELPKVQRGFVWKPFQIEDLWDSLLRRYPVGAVVLSPKSKGKFELLDGQQRATAICLGFGKKAFRGTEDKLKVFIDIERPDSDDPRNYFFRVITKSHPWGYQRYDNSKPLDSANKRKAMALYDCDDFLNTDLDKCFPYDASIPIPFHLFLDAAEKEMSAESFINSIPKAWPLWEKVLKDWYEYLEEEPGIKVEEEVKELLNLNKINRRITEIYRDVQKMLNACKIPALYLDLKDFKTKPIKKTNQLIKKYDDDRNDEIENLFLRLNTRGTPLRGEELNYSILKAKIPLILQKDIEDACEGFCHPARFITIAYRLFPHADKSIQQDGLSMAIKPKQFQKTINEMEKFKKFKLFLYKIIPHKEKKGYNLLKQASLFLEYKKKYPYGLPHIISSKIAETAPEVMFMFLYRLYIKGDDFKEIDIHRKALGMVTLFMWLGKGERNKDHSKLLRNIWPAIKTLNQNDFWSSATVKRAMLDNVLLPIPTFNKKRDRYSLQKFYKYPYQSNSDLFKKFDKETDYGDFAKKMFSNQDLILYSQRHFLSAFFNKKEYYLDDTNLPFDWDHISPNKLAQRKGVPFIIKKSWYNTIGNFRAWPYSLNRSDQDVAPAKKLDPTNKKWRTDANAKEFDKGLLNWNEFISKNTHLIKRDDKLKTKLSEWSFCKDKDWGNCEVEDLRYGWWPVFELIRDRSLSIIEEWYSNFLIEQLIPVDTGNTENVLKVHLNNTKWVSNPQWLKHKDHDFDTKEEINWITKKPIKYNESQLYLYLTHSKYDDEIIEEGNIVFGIYDRISGSFIKSLIISEKDYTNIETDKNKFISGKFTLISTQKEAFSDLFKQIDDWIKNTKFGPLKSKIKEAFVVSLKNELRNKIKK